MAGWGTPSERQDDRATDRDASAERRDGDSQHRDVAADHRDTGALHRDDRSADRLDALRERVDELRRHVLAGLRRVEEVDVDPVDWPDLGPAALARLSAHVAEQARQAALEDRTLLGLLDEFGDELRRAVEDRVASARDRDGAAADRQASERDRDAAATDREAAAGDRDQAAIEREQADPADREMAVPTAGLQAFVDESVVGRGTRAVQDSRRRVIDSRKHLGRTLRPTDGAPAATGGADRDSHPD
jgi:hypothetical protein